MQNGNFSFIKSLLTSFAEIHLFMQANGFSLYKTVKVGLVIVQNGNLNFMKSLLTLFEQDSHIYWESMRLGFVPARHHI